MIGISLIAGVASIILTVITIVVKSMIYARIGLVLAVIGIVFGAMALKAYANGQKAINTCIVISMIGMIFAGFINMAF